MILHSSTAIFESKGKSMGSYKFRCDGWWPCGDCATCSEESAQVMGGMSVRNDVCCSLLYTHQITRIRSSCTSSTACIRAPRQRAQGRCWLHQNAVSIVSLSILVLVCWCTRERERERGSGSSSVCCPVRCGPPERRDTTLPFPNSILFFLVRLPS